MVQHGGVFGERLEELATTPAGLGLLAKITPCYCIKVICKEYQDIQQLSVQTIWESTRGIRVILTEENIEGTVDLLYGGGKKHNCKQ